ncbi:MAG: hypothetical protein EHM25_14295 [Nitrosopumilales archaeon]|nr:MAG: hypothetical protein EHM25_14295 [Nitrosopumilales archaeon]
MDYIQQMRSMRFAMHVVSEKIPTLSAMIEDMKNQPDPDPDLNVLTMSDMEFDMTHRGYDEIHEKIKRFDPEDEYGRVETLSPEEKRGYQ